MPVNQEEAVSRHASTQLRDSWRIRHEVTGGTPLINPVGNWAASASHQSSNASCWLIPIHLAMAFLLVGVNPPAYAKHALLVGVSNYELPRFNQPPLKYPEDDAKAIAEALKSNGYEITLLIGKEATRDSILSTMQSIAKKGTGDSVLIFGFFGHGVQYGDSAYYCAYDTDLRVVTDKDNKQQRDAGGVLLQEPDPSSMVSMREMLDALTISKSGSKLLLADCCRDDPNGARGGLVRRAFGEGLQVNQIPENCAALFACGKGQQAFEHDAWKHGAFTRAFLDVLATSNELTANELSALLYRRVNELVSSVPGIRARQTVSNVTRDLVDLRLDRKSLPRAITNSVGAKLVLINPGTFMMGSPESDTHADTDEKPQRRVTLTNSFYLGETEVTQSQWKRVMGTEPWKGQAYVREGDNYPATYVSWDDAVSYCERLSELEGKAYRLPTEAEWEYACRGRSTTKYSVGDNPSELSRYGWFNENAWNVDEKYAHEVKQKLANAYGLYDMHGNVWEWCSDWYGDYAIGSVTDPVGVASGSFRVARGGCWLFRASVCRSASRNWDDPSGRGNFLGFRLLLSPSVK
jgi:sulfatase modifying factor 1